jgi:UTP--glucose-1-phosphate uridylyltransferase
MTSTTEELKTFATKMRDEGLPEVVIRSFAHYYEQLALGHTGLIPERTIRPVGSVPDSDSFSSELESIGRSALPKTAMVKLNGGLGTGMGLNQAKSLLVVKEGLCFLDIIANQALSSKIPLVLMNSFNTSADSLSFMEGYAELSEGPIPLEFLQHKVPKVLVDTLKPAQSPDAPEREWCPPGHGDIYTAMVTTGILDTMLSAGYEYLFVSNADNLGAVMDLSLLGHFVQERLPFMMEVADRTMADRKGGHLAESIGGGLLLRESAQCPNEDTAQFQDISRHRYFNTNNLWIHLPTLKAEMDSKDQILGLAMIRNKKTLNPRDATSPGVYQLETAMGSAISVFDGAGAVRVPRSRFAPVKTTSDLLAVRSDAYDLWSDYRVESARSTETTIVDLDPTYFRVLDDLELRFPHGPPSLVDCSSFRVRGDVRFGSNIRCVGEVELVNETQSPLQIDSDSLLG